MNETNAQKIYYKKMINERFLKKFQKIFGLFSKKIFQKIHRKYRSFWSQIDDLNMGKQIVPNQVWWGVVIWHSKFPKSWVWAKSENPKYFWKFQLWHFCKWSLLSAPKISCFLSRFNICCDLIGQIQHFCAFRIIIRNAQKIYYKFN